MVDISASDLYNGVEKKVFTFPRWAARVLGFGMHSLLAVRLMICRGCKEDPSKPGSRQWASKRTFRRFVA